MKDQDWIDKYNENYIRLIREHREKEDSHIFINQGIVEWLIEHLTEAKKQYYIKGSDFMTDYRYDMYEEYLKHHNPEHPFLKKVGT
jgi:hypothetical protein